MRRWVVAACVAAALWACGGEAPTAVEPVAPGVAARLYEQKCGLCHGSDGRKMASGAPDLAQSTMTAAERERIIRYGKGLMPPQGSVLTDAEIAGIARFLDGFVAQ